MLERFSCENIIEDPKNYKAEVIITQILGIRCITGHLALRTVRQIVIRRAAFICADCGDACNQSVFSNVFQISEKLLTFVGRVFQRLRLRYIFGFVTFDWFQRRLVIVLAECGRFAVVFLLMNIGSANQRRLTQRDSLVQTGDGPGGRFVTRQLRHLARRGAVLVRTRLLAASFHQLQENKCSAFAQHTKTCEINEKTV
jgi:hypothetical protein